MIIFIKIIFLINKIFKSMLSVSIFYNFRFEGLYLYIYFMHINTYFLFNMYFLAIYLISSQYLNESNEKLTKISLIGK